MSDDPLDPDDWHEEDDESLAADEADADPFADVETDRAGDPFEGLGAPPETGGASTDETGDESREPQSEDAQSGSGVPTDDPSAWQPLPEVSEASEAQDAGSGTATAGGAGVSDGTVTLETEDGTGDPFGGPDPRGDPFEDEEVFERQEVGEVDPDEVWEALEATERAGDEEGRRYAEVSKHTYCEGCEWLSDPPEVSCTHEGTEIVEFLDMETVRLLNCPVVEERRALRNED
jgi:hypothetical protein